MHSRVHCKDKAEEVQHDCDDGDCDRFVSVGAIDIRSQEHSCHDCRARHQQCGPQKGSPFVGGALPQRLEHILGGPGLHLAIDNDPDLHMHSPGFSLL